jgi:hypothetical protein
VRAQRDCHFEDGNCCIECLMGCRIESKQSMPVTLLRRARAGGLEVVSEFEAQRVEHRPGEVSVSGARGGASETYRGKILVLAAGAIGNSRLCSLQVRQAARWGTLLHPSAVPNLGVYDEPIGATRPPDRTKSDEPLFRRNGFKLENVFRSAVAAFSSRASAPRTCGA